MNKEEFELYKKQVSENEDSAIKLLNLNLKLSKQIEEQEDIINELRFDVEHWQSEYEELKRNLEDNYVRKEENPYTEYGISEKDFS